MRCLPHRDVDKLHYAASRLHLISQLRCQPAVCGARRMSLARTPSSLADHCTRCAFASSATGGAKARGLQEKPCAPKSLLLTP